jgi:hypothetical protein
VLADRTRPPGDGYGQLLDRLTARYGPRSLAALQCRFQHLLALHEDVAAGRRRAVEVRTDVDRLTAEIIERYRDLTIDGQPPPRQLRAGDPPLLVLDRCYYDRRYRAAGDSVGADVLELGPAALRHLLAGAVYLYVVDERCRVLVCNRPLTLTNLLLQQNPVCADGTLLVHPMLVPERLTALTAGELVLFGSGTVRGVVANTKSGHFRPPAASGDLLRSLLLRLFPAAEMVTVLPVDVADAGRQGATT